MPDLVTALDRLRSSRTYYLQAEDDEEQARDSVLDAQCDLLEAIAERLLAMPVGK